MSVESKETTGKKKFGFRDVRAAAALLASGRPPKSIQIKKSSGVSSKLSKLKNKVSGATSKILKSKIVGAATTAALGPVAVAFAAKLIGKVKLPKFGFGKLGGGASKVTAIAAGVALGAKIIEETNPEKIRRPLNEGLSASASAMAKPLAETVAKSVATGLVSASLGSGLPMRPREFKTPSSLVKSPRFFNPLNDSFTLDAKENTIAEKAVKHVSISTPENRLYPQRGLLEDEIMYRLVLLAENVYAPTNQYTIDRGWGAVKILDGFRVENSTTSDHEKGEALDLTLGDGSLNNTERCFDLAQWMRDNILYDQLILCFDASAGGQVWIHASFRPDARRRQVLTKAFNDTHVDGLHIYEWTPASSEDQALQAAGDAFSTMLADRQQRLQPIGLDTPTPQDLAGNGIGVGTSGGFGGDCVFPPAGQGSPLDTPNYWEAPPGLNLSSGALYNEIREGINSALGLDINNPEDLDALNRGSGDSFDVGYWISKSQVPDQLTGGRWVVGFHEYWLARIVNCYEGGDCGSASATVSAKYEVDVRWSSNFIC